MFIFETPYVATGALTGFLIGLTGVGGGALMTPILLLVFGVEPATAIATDLCFAACTKLVAAMIHDKFGQIDWQVVRRLWVGSLPMALIVMISVSLGGRGEMSEWLSHAVGVVILITAAGMLLSTKLSYFARKSRIESPGKFKSAQPILTVIAGSFLGFCVALTSIGAGALGSVMLQFIYPLRMNAHRLIATDIVHAIPLTVVAGFGYLVAGIVNREMLVSLLLGSIPAVMVGCWLAGQFSSRWLQIILAFVLITAGLKML